MTRLKITFAAGYIIWSLSKLRRYNGLSSSSNLIDEVLDEHEDADEDQDEDDEEVFLYKSHQTWSQNLVPNSHQIWSHIAFLFQVDDNDDENSNGSLKNNNIKGNIFFCIKHKLATTFFLFLNVYEWLNN